MTAAKLKRKKAIDCCHERQLNGKETQAIETTVSPELGADQAKSVNRSYLAAARL